MILIQRTPSFLFGVAFFALLMTCVEAAPQLAVPQLASPQTADSQIDAPENDERKTVAQKIQRHDELIAEMREQIQKITEANFHFYLDGVDQSYDWKDRWESGVTSIVKLRREFEALATDLFLNHASDPGVPGSLNDTMSVVVAKLLERDNDQDTVAVLKRLIELKPDDEQLKFDLALTYLKTNRFADANELIDSIPPAKREALVGADNKLLPQRFQLQAMYEKEQSILNSESDDDLPQVKLLTTRGPVTVELFENQAPETVGNFIHLVQTNFYTDVIFHRVIEGFMAQTGMVVKTGDYWAQKGVDYTIYDETEGGRSHFYGYLSMAKTNQPNSGNSQFFITYQPTIFLDGRHTVFGRVIDGMDSVGRLNPTFVSKTEEDKPPQEVPIEGVVPDRILSAEVIRKRSHEYRPNKVEAN